MIEINNSSAVLFGKSVSLYAVMPFIALVFIVAMNCIIAYKKQYGVNFFFRLSVIVFAVGAVIPLFAAEPHSELKPFLVPLCITAIAVAYVIIARLFGKSPVGAFKLAMLSSIIYMSFSKFGCFLAGCCCGKPVSHGISVIYGEHTFCALKNTRLFPVQLVVSLIMLCIFVVALCVLMKSDNLLLPFIFSAIFLTVYYGEYSFTVPSANQMIIGNIDFSKINATLCIAAGVCLIIIFFIKEKTNHEKEKHHH